MHNAQDFDIDQFIKEWVSACTHEEGRATTVKIEHLGFLLALPHTRVSRASICMRLEQLESQSKLMDLITDSVVGMANTRKALQSLGKTPDVSDVQQILDKAPHVSTMDPCVLY